MINCTLYGEGDPTFSYKIYKNPASSPFDIKYNVTAFFVDDTTFNISIQKGNLLEIENLSDLQTWNVESLFSHSATTITTIFNDVLRSATRKDAAGIAYHPHKYKMVFVPCIEHSKLSQIAALCEIDVEVNDKNHVTFVSNRYTLRTFLQRVFICMFINYGGYRFANKEQITMFTKFVAGWNSQNKTEVTEMLTGRRISLFQTVNDAGIELERKVNLHEMKHNAIGIILKNREFTNKKIVELGCGTGQFVKTAKINSDNYIGVDNDSYRIEKAKDKLRKYTFIKGDILSLNQDVLSKMDIALLLEVVEHLEQNELQTLVDNLNYVYQPEYIVITTPNRSANKLWQIDGLRHKDHKFEFDENEYADFLKKFVNYEPTTYVVSTKEQTGFDIEASFITLLLRKEEIENNYQYSEKYFQKLEEKHIRYGRLTAPIVLPQISYIFNPDQLKTGLASNHFANTKPFYLGSSIAPADVKDANKEIEGFVEHPQYAVDYYQNKGYTDDFVFQVKEMGSRANVLAFKNMDTAKKYGYSELVTITSRRGYRFFRDEEENKKYCDLAHTEIFKYDHGYSVLMLDCEITPWQYLAEGLIEREFLNPIKLQLEGGLYDNNIKSLAGMQGNFDPKGCNDFIDSLNNFTPNEPLKLNVFDILLIVNDNGLVSENGLTIRYVDKSLLIDSLFANETNIFVRPIKSFHSRYKIFEAWNYAIENKKEGVVVKPAIPFLSDGRLIQPAIKARTPQFLRLIYGGPNYDEYSHLIKDRNVKAKRARAIREAALSNMMIESFSKRDFLSLQRAIAAFHSINIKTDGTL